MHRLYCLGGDQEGAEGQTGWMFVEQMKIIFAVLPLTFRLEMSDNVQQINSGKEVQQVQDEASLQYFTRKEVLRVWEHGDGSIYCLRLVPPLGTTFCL